VGETPRFQDAVRSLLRDRLLDAAAELTNACGWARTRMSGIAERAGVSRGTVYNEFGSKEALAEAMILREMETFLAGVRTELDAHRDDLVEGIVAAAEYALTAAASNQVLKEILTGGTGPDGDLLPLLTTQAEPFLAIANATLTAYVRQDWPDLGLDDEELSTALDAVVRLIVSHIVLPVDPPERVARRIGWIAGHVLSAASASVKG